MAGQFELYKDTGGKFRFRLKASNGQVIATGRGLRDQGERTQRDRVGAHERGQRDPGGPDRLARPSATLEDQTA